MGRAHINAWERQTFRWAQGAQGIETKGVYRRFCISEDEHMTPAPRQRFLRSAALLCAAIVTVVMLAAGIAYKYTGDFTGLATYGARKTPGLGD